MTGVLIIVENLTVPLDRRVWQEATALVRDGFTVSVVCPKGGSHQAKYEYRDGVHIFRHGLLMEASGMIGYLLEYAWAWLAEFYLAWVVRRRIGFDVIQACNPPDTIFSIGLIFKALFGTRFVFDHHDPFADLFALKFPRRRWLLWLPRWAERMSLRVADEVITTSEELRKLAINRAGVPPERVHLVRSGIDLRRVPETLAADPALKRGKPFLVLYIGIMGPQDGLDVLLRAINVLVHARRRRDVHVALAGAGTEFLAMRALCHDLGLDDYVEFTGFLEGDGLFRLLATADVGVCPDPKNDFNDKLSMNKILEYMAFGIPVVQFDLNEGRFIAGGAAVYAGDNNPSLLADRIAILLDDADRRRRMGEIGRRRIAEHFSWAYQEGAYLNVYRRLMDEPAQAAAHAGNADANISVSSSDGD